MHLLNISNFDYGMMAGLFLIILVISYKFRRTNTSSDNFLLMREHNLPVFISFSSLLGVGVIEFVALSSYGAYAGLPALCVFLPVFLLSAWLFDKLAFGSRLFQVLEQAQVSSLHSRFTLVCYAFFMLLVAGATISIVVTLFKSLLGWQFANSTLSLAGIALVGLLIGGVVAATYNQALSWLAVIVILLITTVYAYIEIGSGNLISNLQQVALNNKLPDDYYTSPHGGLTLLWQIWLVIAGSMILLLINPLYQFKQKKTC